MTAQIVTRCEVNMSTEEQRMLQSVTDWIENMFAQGDVDDMPEGIEDILSEILESIVHLLSLVVDEH